MKFHGNQWTGATSITDRFWDKVDRRGPDECWEWQASLDEDGYGKLGSLRAHRVAYELQVGPIPEGEEVRHTCDNPRCVNGAHLIPGSQADNSRDMVERGRSTLGERNPGAKLTGADVIEIRKLAETMTGRDIAELMGVTPGAVSMILSRKRWSHV